MNVLQRFVEEEARDLSTKAAKMICSSPTRFLFECVSCRRRRLWTSIAAVAFGIAIVSPLSAARSVQPILHAFHPGSSTAVARDETLLPFTVKDSIEMVHIVDPWEDSNEPPQFSPDRKRFLIVEEKGVLANNSREYSLVVFAAAKFDRPTRLATFRSSSNRAGIQQARWLTNDSIALIGENPDQVPQVYLVNCSTHTLRPITSDVNGVVSYDVTGDLETVVYSSAAGGDMAQVTYKDEHGFAVSDEHLFDLSSGEWRRPRDWYQTFVRTRSSPKARPIKGGPFWSLEGRLRLWVSPDGKYAVTERPPFPVPERWESYQDPKLRSAVHSILATTQSPGQVDFLGQAMLISAGTGVIRPLVDAPLTVSYASSVVWSSDGESVIVAGTYLPPMGISGEGAASRDVPVVAEFSIPRRSFRRIANIPLDEQWSIQSTKAGDLLVHAQREKADGSYEVLPDRLYHREPKQWVIANPSAPLRTTEPQIVVRQALTHWPRLVRIDSITGRESVIEDPNPQFRHRRFGRVELIHWTGKLGEPWTGGLIYPADYDPEQRYPLVIQTHDFNPDRFLLDGPFTTAMAAQELANKGIVVLQLGEGTLHEQTISTPREGPYYLSAFESAVDVLDRMRLVDRNCVGLIGFSRSAYHVKYALTHSAYQFAAATAAEGIDFTYGQMIGVYANDPLAQGEFVSMYGGFPWQTGWQNWMRDSLTFNFNKIEAPLRLEANDNPNAIIEEWETFAALRLLNKPVELIFIPRGDHPVSKPWERMTSQEGNVDWFAFWLKGEEDADPRKTEQYVRWRRLRGLQQANK